MKLGQRMRAQSGEVPETPVPALDATASEPTWQTAASAPAAQVAAAPTAPRLVAEKNDERERPSDPMQAFKERLHEQLMDKLGGKLFESSQSERDMRATVVDMITQLLASESVSFTLEERQTIVSEITDDVLGHGPIDRYLKDPTVSEVMVMGTSPIYVEKNGKLIRTKDRFFSQDQLRRVIERIVANVGRRIDESSPMVDARLADGSRVNAVIPPLAVDGAALTIRKFSRDPLQIHHLIEKGSLTAEAAQLLAACVAGHLNILVSGGTGTGKTTMLNILSRVSGSSDSPSPTKHQTLGSCCQFTRLRAFR